MPPECSLYISIDVGGSQTKIIYQFNGSKSPQYLLMSPGIEQITKEDLEQYKQRLGWIGAPTPIKQAWLEWKGSIFVVGDFVSEFAPQDRIFERKYENALYKVLAAVGVILETHKVVNKRKGNTEPPKVNLYLGLLLPWNEYNDRHRFQEQLVLMLKSFKFRGKSWKVSLSGFLCRPEGGGLAAIRIKQNGLGWLQSHKIAVLMFGHRNVTAIYFEGGIIKRGDSPSLGFSTFLDDICSRVSGLERDKLAAAIFKGLESAHFQVYKDETTVHPQWVKLKQIAALATAKDEILRASEIEDIAAAIEMATRTYWLRIKKWLDKNLPAIPNEVIIGGGAAAFLEPELEEYFNCQLATHAGAPKRQTGERPPKYSSRNYHDHAELVWVADIQQQIQKIFELNWQERTQQSFRLIDCFGMFDQLKDFIKETENAES